MTTKEEALKQAARRVLDAWDTPEGMPELCRWMDDLRAALEGQPACGLATFALGDLVRKKSGSAWQGRVVGTYSTSLTQEGYAIESSAHPGSVQIYPVSALEKVPE